MLKMCYYLVMNSRHFLIALAVCAACFVVVALRPEIIVSIFVLIFIGVIPGTSLTVPSWITLGIMILLLIMAIRWVFDEPVYRAYVTPKDLARRDSARRKVLRRTRVRVTAKDTTPATAPARLKI